MSTRRAILVGTCLAISAGASACGFDIEERGSTRTVEHAVNQGSETANSASSEFAAVFFVEVTVGSATAVCSASLITPHLLLTAGHCVTGQFQSVDCDTTTLSAPLSIDSFRISSEADLSGTPQASWKFWDVAAVELIAPGALLCGNDVALVQLEQAVPEDVARPLPVFRDSPRDLDFRLVGYGAVHPSGTGERVRRVSDALLVECVTPSACDSTLVEGSAGAGARRAPSIAPGEFVGTPAGCPGDSGGPALHTASGAAEILGVLSRGTEDCSENVYSQIPIEGLAARVVAISEALGDEVPGWTLAPEIDPEDPDPEVGGAGGESTSGAGGSVPFGNQKLRAPDAGCSCSSALGFDASPSSAGLALGVLAMLVCARRRRSFEPE